MAHRRCPLCLMTFFCGEYGTAHGIWSLARIAPNDEVAPVTRSPNPTRAERQFCDRRKTAAPQGFGRCLFVPIAPAERHSVAPFSVELCLGAALGCVPPQGATWDHQISWRTPLSASAQYTLLLMQTAAAGLSACAERGSRWRTTSNLPETRKCRRPLRLSGVYTAI
jgi:hypothetical protein